MKPEVSIASDYAVVHCPNGMEFYYGYEVTKPAKPRDDEDAEWCFEFRYPKCPRKNFRIPHSELGVSNSQYEVTECLLAGIAQWLSRFAIKT